MTQFSDKSDIKLGVLDHKACPRVVAVKPKYNDTYRKSAVGTRPIGQEDRLGGHLLGQAQGIGGIGSCGLHACSARHCRAFELPWLRAWTN
jgi:hypothetical protein